MPLGYAGPLLERSINSSCIQIPNELPNVISVSATGVNRTKAYFSNYASAPFKFVQVSMLHYLGHEGGCLMHLRSQATSVRCHDALLIQWH